MSLLLNVPNFILVNLMEFSLGLILTFFFNLPFCEYYVFPIVTLQHGRNDVV